MMKTKNISLLDKRAFSLLDITLSKIVRPSFLLKYCINKVKLNIINPRITTCIMILPFLGNKPLGGGENL